MSGRTTNKARHQGVDLRDRRLETLANTLVQFRVCLRHCREIVLEFKDLMVAVTILVFFLIGVIETLVPIINTLLRH
ncbi:MAG: hypothetical protein WAM70_02185 [Pyrinomonadaceae bacterium]